MEGEKKKTDEEDDAPPVEVLILILELQNVFVRPLEDGSAKRMDSEKLVGQICTFLTIFQHLDKSNRVAVLACSRTGVQCLQQELSVDAMGTSYNPTGAARKVVAGLQNISSEISNAPLDAEVDTRHMSAALSKAMCMVNRANHAAASQKRTANCRVLALHSSPDVTSQYVACMNASFAARRLGVPVDGIPLTGQDASYIELAASLTGGSYVRMKNPEALLQHLTCCFSASTATRALMQLPDAQGINFKSTCFCHIRAIDYGFVCSVCLSVFCTPHEKCTTCGTEFTGTLTRQVDR